MNAQPLKKEKMTPEAYLAMERNSEIKHEYYNGEIFDMVGAKKDHVLINTNITAELRSRFISNNSTCRVFSNDMRVRIPEQDHYTYPDVAVACGEIQFEDDALDTLINPIVIMEILSDSTEAYDRGDKFAAYRRIPSLQEYILISQKRCRVEQFSREGDGTWRLVSFDDMEDVMTMGSIDCTLALSEIYRWIAFE